MAKIKKPARKGTASTAAPKKKAGKKKPNAKPRKPIPQQAVERTVSARMREIQENTVRMVEAEQRLGLEPLPTPTPAPRYPAPPPPSKTSKFWRQYQDTETGEFIGWAQVLKRASIAVVSRLRLRKPGAAKK